MRERKWDPYAQTYDLVVDTIAEMEAAENAARRLSTLIDRTPRWLVEEAGLDKALDLLNNVVGRGDDDPLR